MRGLIRQQLRGRPLFPHGIVAKHYYQAQSATCSSQRLTILKTSRVSVRTIITSASDITQDTALRADGLGLELDSVLKRAQHHGIIGQARLDYEADVGHRLDIGSRITDQIASRQDLELWVVLFDYACLQHGETGAQNILRGMRFRGKPVKLYEDDDESEQLWNGFLPLTATNKNILDGLCNPSTGIGRDLPTLFVDIVRYLLKNEQPQQAVMITGVLRSTHFRGASDSLCIFEEFVREESSLATFFDIHKRLPFAPIYSEVIPRLWQVERVSDAFAMHDYLVQHQDLPTRIDHIAPFARYLARQGKPIQPFVESLKKVGVFYQAQLARIYTEERAAMLGDPSTALSRHLGVSGDKVSDEFVARVFATRSVSFEFALNGLRLFGLREIGPLAVREMALSADDLSSLKQRFAKLKDLQVDLGSSAYVNVVYNLCMSDSDDLLALVVHNDQHHEVYEEEETQKRLLAGYYNTKDWQQVNRTLAVLNRGKKDIDARRNSARLILQSAIIVRDWRGALQILANMQKQGHCAHKCNNRPFDKSLRSMAELVLPRNKDLRFRNPEYVARTPYLIGFLQDLAVPRTFVAAAHWRRILYALGASGRLDDLEKLCIWLAWYHTKVKRRSNDRVTVYDLFDHDFQASVIEWGFCHVPSDSSDMRSTASEAFRGMHLLRRLRNGFGVSMDYEPIKQAFVQKLRSYFRRQEVIDQYIHFFEAAWMGDITRIRRRKDRKAVSRAQPPSYEDLAQLRFVSRSRLFSDSESTLAEDLPEQINTLDIVRDLTSEDLRDQDPQHDFVEYSDLFHPSSKDYNTR